MFPVEGVGVVSEKVVEALERLAEILTEETAKIVSAEQRSKAVKGIVATILGVSLDRLAEVDFKDASMAHRFDYPLLRCGGKTVGFYCGDNRVVFEREGYVYRCEIELKTEFGTKARILIASPAEPWETDSYAPGPEPRSHITKAVLNLLERWLPDMQEFTQTHFGRYCDEMDKVKFGVMDESVPIYVYVEETYPCACTRDDC